MRDLTIFVDDDSARAAVMCQRMTEEIRRSTIWVQTAEEAIDVLKNYTSRLKVVYLGYDFGGYKNMHPADDKSGMEIVRYLEKQKLEDFDGCEFIIHSWNEYGAEKMLERLQKKKFKVTYQPFGQ